MVVLPPCLHDPLRVEPLLVEAFIMQPPVADFAERVLHGFAGFNEVQRDGVLELPILQEATDQLGAVVEHELRG